MVYLLGQVALWVTCSAFQDAPEAVLIVIGTLMGACIPLLFVAWMALCPPDFRTALICGSGLLILTALLNYVFSVLSPAVMMVAWFACCAAGTLAPCLYARASIDGEVNGGAGSVAAGSTDEATSATVHLAELVSSLWMPLLGLIVCMMAACLGGETLNDAEISGEYIGIACAAVLALALCFVRTNIPLVPLIDNVAVPALMAGSIVLGAVTGETASLVPIAANLVFVPVAFAALYALASVMAIRGYSRLLVAGTTLAACCLAMLVGSALNVSLNGVSDGAIGTGPVLRVITYGYYAVVFINLGVTALRLMTHTAPRGDEEAAQEHGARQGQGPRQSQHETFEEAREKRLEELAKKYGLTDREREVFRLLGQGYRSESISHTLLISANTVRTHMKNIYRKLNVGSYEELLLLVNDRGPRPLC